MVAERIGGEGLFIEGDEVGGRPAIQHDVVDEVLVARIAARRLVAGGAREIRVNEETEYMVVRGMIRSKDVSADNSVLSTQIADASIEYYGKGVLADKQKPGWFSRLMDNVWPF